MGEKFIINKENNEIVGKLFKRCKDCGIILDQNHKGHCPSCGSQPEDVGILNEFRNDNCIFIGK